MTDPTAEDLRILRAAAQALAERIEERKRRLAVSRRVRWLRMDPLREQLPSSAGPFA